jgi:hypothetical protein
VLLVCTVYSVLYIEIAQSRKPFGIGHMYIYTFLLRMTDTMTSQNFDFSSWDTLYIDIEIETLESDLLFRSSGSRATVSVFGLSVRLQNS